MLESNDILISVVMPVYNTKLEYLKQSIESILNQTYRNFEFIIVDDESNTEVQDFIHSYKDPRIVIIRNEKNSGVTKSLNNGIAVAQGKYIARMDADDVSYVNRLSVQLEYMEHNPNVVVCGALADVNGSGDIIGATFTRNTMVRKIRLSLYNEGIIHPTAFIRRSALDDRPYDENISKAQDYELWTRMIEKGDIEIVPSILFMYRVHNDQVSTKSKTEQDKAKEYTQRKMLCKLGVFSEEETSIFLDFSNRRISDNVDKYIKLINLLSEKNKIEKLYDIRLYQNELIMHLFYMFKSQHKLSFNLGMFILIHPSALIYMLREKMIMHKRVMVVKNAKRS